MNPVLRKDLLGLLRLRRVAAIQIVFVAVLAVMVLAAWPQGGVLAIAAEGQDSLLLGLVLGQLVLLILFVPGIAAVSLVGEREANTFEMLYASRLSPASILAGKVLSAVAFPLMLLIAGLPFVALLAWRGAVDVDTLAKSYAILVLAAVFLAILSLAVSALSRQTATALVISYAIVLVVCGGLLVPGAIMLEQSSGPTATVLHYARGLSPVAAALSVLQPTLSQFGGRPDQGLIPLWQVFLPAAAAVTLVCFLVIVVRLRKPPAETDRLPAGAELVEGERRSIGRKVMFLIDDKKARKPVGSFNPVAGKERKTNALRSGRWMIRLFYGALVLSLGLAVMALYGGVEYGNLLAYVAMILIALQLGLVALVDPSLTSPAVSSEMETGTFETLRLTPLSGGQIFWGKLLPLVPAAMLPVLALLPAYGAVWFVDDSYGTHFLYLLPVVVLAVLFSLATALACSTFVNNTARATVAAYLIVAALFILPMLAWFASGTHINADIARWLAMPSPLVMGMNLLPTGSSAIVDLWETHLIVMGSLIVLLLIVARTRLAALLRQG